jgi:two-component system, NtrC family, nitrogen regulation sensor histidine kinase NtrY
MTAEAAKPDIIASTVLSEERRGAWIGWTLIAVSLATVVFTFLFMSDFTPFTATETRVQYLHYANGGLVLLLLVLVAFEVQHVMRARRARSAGSQLHMRIVAIIVLAAALPTLVLAATATASLDRVLAPWFFGPIRSFVEGAEDFSRAFLTLQCQNLRRDSSIVASDLSRGINNPLVFSNRRNFRQFVTDRAIGQQVSFLVIINRSGEVIESAATNSAIAPPMPSPADFQQISSSLCLSQENDQPLRVLLPMNTLAGAEPMYLFAARPLDRRTNIVFQNAELAANEYRRAENVRQTLQFNYGLMFVLVTLVILLSALWASLRFAEWLVAPIGRLIGATDEVASGNLFVQVPVKRRDDDISHLGETFNKMTSQLRRQRDNLIKANEQNDQRRRFTEAVLSGVPAGVIGLDKAGKVNSANPMAEQLLNRPASEMQGKPISDIQPEFASLFAEAKQGRVRLAQGETVIRTGTKETTLTVKITQERGAGGFVLTLDDMTDLVLAQRTSAWADVARRIAHEIKNPLTPIQLSAERIRRKYGKVITEDREVFDQCTDTIVRQVDDIKRMVDEFSSFARMPKPTLQNDNLSEVLKQVLFLATVGYPDVTFVAKTPENPVMARFDRRLVSQALTNVLKNATEGISMVSLDERGEALVTLEAVIGADRIEIMVTDSGKGFPVENRQRLLEPYMTTRDGGTGLGLPIVAKIFEDHGGGIELLDNPIGRGARVKLWFPHSATPLAIQSTQEQPA